MLTSIVSTTAGSPAYVIIIFVLLILVEAAICGGILYLFVLVIKALRKYLHTEDVRKENADFFQSLGEALKNLRLQKGMTQEFVAEQLGVSRQAVSKWENGTSDPSTANLLALAKLYGVSPEELLKSVQS